MDQLRSRRVTSEAFLTYEKAIRFRGFCEVLFDAMKVLVLSPPLGKAGGIQRYTVCLVRALQELLGDQNVRCVVIPEAANGSVAGKFSATLKLRFAWHALRESTRWKPDLIVCCHLAVGPIGWLLARLGRRPYWVIVYGIEAWGELSGWKGGALQRADRVIGISAFSSEQVVKQHEIDPRRIAMLPCALDDSLLQLVPTDDGICARIPRGRRLVLTVARMAAAERYKGHDEVLRALPAVVAKLPDVTYAIVGNGDDRPRLEALAQFLGLTQQAVFTGEITDAELVALYRRSEVFLLPARTVIDKHNPKGEGFGIVYLEAMAFGKPVIGPNYGAPVEVIQHGKTGLLVDPKDPAQVAEALLSLLDRPEWAREMGRAGSEWVRQEYSYASFRERLRGILGIPAAADHPA